MLALLVVAMLQHGLFFIDVQKPGVFLAVLLGTIVFFLVKVPLQWRDPMIWGIAAFLLGHLLALPGSARPAQAIHGVVSVVAGLLAFFLGRVAIKGKNGPYQLAGGIVFTTVFLVGHSLLNLGGVLHSVDSIIGSRMSSLLQYSNTFALFCAVGVLAAASLALRQDKWWALWHLGLNIGLTGVIMSQSRAIYLLLPVLLIVWGYFVRRPAMREAVFFAFDGVAALLTSTVLFVPSNNPLARSVWVLGATVIIWIVCYYGITVLRAGVDRLGKHSRKAGWAAGGIVLIVAIAVLIRFGQGIASRLGSLQLSDPAVLGRIYTLIDGLRVVQAHPLGLGADGWRAGYFGFASYFYITNAAHSFWVEVAVNGGFLAILAWLFILGVSAVRFWRRARQKPADGNTDFAINLAIALGAVGIAIHSAIDWDLAFLGLLFFFWFLLGYVDGWCAPQPLEKPEGVNRPAVAIVGLALLTIVGLQWGADGALNVGVSYMQRKNFPMALTSFQEAAARDPFNSFAHADLAYAHLAAAPSGDQQAEYLAEKEFALSERYDRLNYQIYIRHGQYHMDKGRFDDAVKYFEKAVSLGKWRPDAWANLFSLYAKAAEKGAERGDGAELKRWVVAGRAALARYEAMLVSQPAFTQNYSAMRFPEKDSDLQKSMGDFRKIQAAVPQA